MPEVLPFDHEHCRKCYKIECQVLCLICPIVPCNHKCGHIFHACKQDDHETLCSMFKIPCINAVYGCPIEMLRCQIAAHLIKCPASVVNCSMEWNRWPFSLPEKIEKNMFPEHKIHARCGQLDIALALRDQRMLHRSMEAPQSIRRSLRNSLTTRFPAVPFQYQQGSVEERESPQSGPDTSTTLSDEEVDAPWQKAIEPLGLTQSVLNKLFRAKKLADETMCCRKDDNSLTPAQLTRYKLDTIMSHGVDELDDGDELRVSGLKDVEGCDEIDQLTLKKMLSVDLTIETISRYRRKSKSMFTFLCAQDFRRDEFAWHYKNIHDDIHSGVSGWLEQRCPLAQYGCTFSTQNLYPSHPNNFVIYSPILESFGISRKGCQSVCRDSTPELFASKDVNSEIHLHRKEMKFENLYICDKINIPERNKSFTECSDNNDIDVSFEKDENRKFGQTGTIEFDVENYAMKGEKLEDSEEGIHLITGLCDMPHEILYHLLQYLDNFSLNNLSLTCRFFSDLARSQLGKRGIVVLQWSRKKVQESVTWFVAFKRWKFSTSISPINHWGIQDLSVISQHLKTCPFNVTKSFTEDSVPIVCWVPNEECKLYNYCQPCNQ